MAQRIVSVVVIVSATIAIFLSGSSGACTLFRVTAKDGTIISARTMEFGLDVNYALVQVPRGHSFASPSSGDETGLRWKTRYGYLGSSAFGDTAMVMDGLNEKGLAFSYLWYESAMKWQKVGPDETGRALAHHHARVLGAG